MKRKRKNWNRSWLLFFAFCLPLFVASKMKPAKPKGPILVCLFVFMFVIDFHLWSISCCFCFQNSIRNLQKKTSVHGLQTNMCVCMCRCTWTCVCVCVCVCMCIYAYSIHMCWCVCLLPQGALCIEQNIYISIRLHAATSSWLETVSSLNGLSGFRPSARWKTHQHHSPQLLSWYNKGLGGVVRSKTEQVPASKCHWVSQMYCSSSLCLLMTRTSNSSSCWKGNKNPRLI